MARVKTRREFLGKAASLAALGSAQTAIVPAAQATSSEAAGKVFLTQRVSLDGSWQFRLDPQKSGEIQNWHKASGESGWNEVTVPHTWQITPASTDYFGVAWYRRAFDCRKEWENRTVRIEFEAVFHSANVWINGTEAGQHLRKGYTAFAFDITSLLNFSAQNVVVVKVSSMFDEQMLPRGRSFDWTNDGGIYRPVHLLITPRMYIERVDVDAIPDLANKTADLEVTAFVRNRGHVAFTGQISCEVVNEKTGTVVTRAASNEEV